MIIPSLLYALRTIQHKWFVLIAGLKIGCPLWRLITHDLSKFGRHELPHYGRQFFGKADKPTQWKQCWLHHQNHNDHHWEYWVVRQRWDKLSKEPQTIPMSSGAIKEMIADWLGAGRAYEGSWPTLGNWPWFDNNFRNLVIHQNTRLEILEILFKNELIDLPGEYILSPDKPV